MSHLEPSDTKISEGLRPALLYSFSHMAALSSPFPCSAPYLQVSYINLFFQKSSNPVLCKGQPKDSCADWDPLLLAAWRIHPL